MRFIRIWLRPPRRLYAVVISGSYFVCTAHVALANKSPETQSKEEHSPCTATLFTLALGALVGNAPSRRLSYGISCPLSLSTDLLDLMSPTVFAAFPFSFNTGFGTTVMSKIPAYTVTSISILCGAPGVVPVLAIISAPVIREAIELSQHQFRWPIR
jgi:hypothetical protein